jgi:hypothetical protein
MKILLLSLVLILPAVPALAGFSVDLPVVARIQGATTFFYTDITVTNHSDQSTNVAFEYISGDLTVDAFGILVASLAPHASFHQDDLFLYLANQGFITEAQANAAIGSLLVNFSGATFTTGNEASAVVRTYNYVTPNLRPSIGYAYRGQVLRQNGKHTVSSLIRNSGAAGAGPQVVTNMGFENVGFNDAGAVDPTPVTIQLTFYDGRTGAQLGPQPSVTLQSGQITQINDVWTAEGLPAAANEVLVVGKQTAGTAQINGYVLFKDVSTNDPSFFLMQ